MQKQQKIAFKSLAIKARLANKIRTDLFTRGLFKYRHEALTDKEKIDFFEAFLEQAKEMHLELRLYKMKRRDKAKVEELRAKKGFRPKRKRTTKEEYEKSLQPA